VGWGCRREVYGYPLQTQRPGGYGSSYAGKRWDGCHTPALTKYNSPGRHSPAGVYPMDVEEYRSIISNAIEREIEAYTFYRMIHERVTDENLKGLFNELAGEESKHRRTLEALLLREPEKLGFDTTRDYKVADALETPPLSADLKPLDGLVIAIRKELDAMQLYTQLAGLSVDPEQIELFESLAAMERGHKARLEDIYTNMAFPEVW